MRLQVITSTSYPAHSLLYHTQNKVNTTHWRRVVCLPLHQLGGGEVGRHGLVVFALHGKRMAVGYPRRPVRPL